VTAAEWEALLELVRWDVALEDDAARQVGETSPTAAKPKESRARIEAGAEG
jgi:hypothetical protein